MNNTKNILFILNSFSFGGAEKQCLDLINNIDKKRCNAGVAYLDPNEAILPELEKKSLLCVECLQRHGKFDRSVLQRLKMIIELHQFDTIMCINEYAFLYAFFCVNIYRLKVRIIAAIHHTLPRPGVWEWIKSKLYQFLLNRTETILFVCRNQLDYWVHEYHINRSKSMVIYNGIDIEKYRDIYSPVEKLSLKKQLGFREDDFLVGICAVLRPEKKHLDFVQAIHRAGKTDSGIKGLIIGDGPERAKIEKVIKDYNLQQDIIMVGFQAEVRPFISICDCMVLTSHAVETFSIAALESMSMGKPVVMTNIGGATEQVTPGKNGYLYKKGDINELTLTLLKMKKDGNSGKMGLAARQRVKENFSLATMVQSYERLLLT